MPTLADVAKLAGVSKATASRALSRPQMLLPETIERVRLAARTLGYVPNTAARQLARGRTGLIATVIPTLDNAFFTPIIGGAEHCADAEGLQVTVAVRPLESARELDSFARLARQVDGFILIAPRGSDDLLLAASEHKPTVLVDREIAGLTSVVADTASAFAAMVRHLADEGHRRILYLGGPGGSWQNRQRTAAVRAAAKGRTELRVLGPYPPTFAAGAGAADAVCESGATAVIPYATSIGLGLQHALFTRDDAGRELLVSSEQGIVDALGLDVPSIDVDGKELGHTAAELLVAQLAGESGKPTATRLPVRLRLGLNR